MWLSLIFPHFIRSRCNELVNCYVSVGGLNVGCSAAAFRRDYVGGEPTLYLWVPPDSSVVGGGANSTLIEGEGDP